MACTPASRHADLTALSKLPPTSLAVSLTPQSGRAGGFASARVSVRNAGAAIAFQVRLKLVHPGTGEEILPVFWDYNYF